MKAIAVVLALAALCAVAHARAAMPTPSAPPLNAMPPGQQPPGQQPVGQTWSTEDDSGGSGGETYATHTQPPAAQRPMYGQNGHGQRMPGPANPPHTQYYESAQSVTEVQEHSYASNVGDSFMGALFGVVLFGAAHVLLFWNEGRTLRRETALAAAGQAVKELDADQYNPQLEGALVHAVHRIESKETLEDSDVGLTGDYAVPALKLVRRVEVYQWVEKSHSRTEKQIGGGSRTVTTYTYEKEWRSDVLNSSAYKNPPFPANPTQKPLQSITKTARNVSFGAYTLSASQVESLSAQETVPLPPQIVSAAVRQRVGAAQVSVTGSTVYLGDPAYPKVGDVRIEFRCATAQIVSVLAQQTGRSFGPYHPAGAGADGESVDLLSAGTHSASSLIASEQSTNAMLKWGLRVVGFVLMWCGLALTAEPLSAIANVLPFVGSIVGAVAGGLTFLVCLPLTLLTISIAWIYYRPRVGVALLVMALIAFYFVHVAAVSTGAGAAIAHPAAATAAVHASSASAASAGACFSPQKAFDDCTAHNNGNIAACQYYWDQLTACKKR